MGILVPLVGLCAFVLCIFWNVYEEPFDKGVFEDDDKTVVAVGGSINKVSDEDKSIEMKAASVAEEKVGSVVSAAE
jgi:hypothetical protein